MKLTPRERLLRAFRHEEIDHLPTQVNYTNRQGDQMADFFGVTRAELPKRLGNHLVRVDITHAKRPSEDGTVLFDWWGAGFDTGEEGYFVRDSPLAESLDLDAFPWPDPTAPGLLDDAMRIIAADGGEHFIVPNFGFSLFERAWSLRGLQQFLMDLIDEQDFVNELFDRIVEIQLVLIRRFLDLGVDGGYFGDDYGAQKNLLISPKMWRTMIKPRLARMFAPFREAGLPVILHSDGQIQSILPDLVEIGLTVYNPVQPEVTDHAALRQQFGTQLAYYGGVSTQTVLPFGTPDAVREATLTCARTLAPDGTGLLIAPSHRMMSDIPMQNVVALLGAFHELEEGPA